MNSIIWRRLHCTCIWPNPFRSTRPLCDMRWRNLHFPTSSTLPATLHISDMGCPKHSLRLELTTLTLFYLRVRNTLILLQSLIDPSLNAVV